MICVNMHKLSSNTSWKSCPCTRGLRITFRFIFPYDQTRNPSPTFTKVKPIDYIAGLFKTQRLYFPNLNQSASVAWSEHRLDVNPGFWHGSHGHYTRCRESRKHDKIWVKKQRILIIFLPWHTRRRRGGMRAESFSSSDTRSLSRWSLQTRGGCRR